MLTSVLPSTVLFTIAIFNLLAKLPPSVLLQSCSEDQTPILPCDLCLDHTLYPPFFFTLISPNSTFPCQWESQTPLLLLFSLFWKTHLPTLLLTVFQYTPESCRHRWQLMLCSVSCLNVGIYISGFTSGTLHVLILCIYQHLGLAPKNWQQCVLLWLD